MGILITLTIAFLLVAFPLYGQNADSEYERISLHTMLLSYHSHSYEKTIKDVFGKYPFPERFNDHNIGAKSIVIYGGDDDQSKNIMEFCRQVNLAQKMVAKWFNRDRSTGNMNMNLVKERGLYNATQTQINVARASMRGLALLEDAGENLIKQTYLVVNDIQYKSHTRGISLLSPSSWGELKGFTVEVTSYLFRLKWNDDLATEFYNNYYTENGIKDHDKVEAFVRDGSQWQMEYAGKTFSKSNKISKREASFTPRLLLEKVTTRALDKNLAQLQHNYPDFRIKAPLTNVEPLKAYVGLKEDITPQSRFEVLERVIDKEGKLSYKRVGIIKPVTSHIWDNRYMADDEDADYGLGYTEFEKVSGSTFMPGMLIREIVSEIEHK